MGYAQAVEKAWNDITALAGDNKYSVKFLADTYDVDLDKREVISLSCNTPAKEYIIVLLLHYLKKRLKLKILPAPTGEWINFKQLEGGDGYYPAFKKRTIDVVLRKYRANPQAILDLIGRFCAKRVQIGDLGVVIEALEKVPILITLWKGDEEFGPEANILFDAGIAEIFCTEDIVVLTEFLVHLL
ncbi:MAG: DUF3786 domain-containing protein [Candidatus Omnitrophica bacterium]|nr:DUF3786 domain-containing protein [Candidatus Omnitrophota bacterium]